MKHLRYTFLFVIAISFTLIQRADCDNKNPTRTFEYQYPKPDQGVIRILTYNVYDCRGMDEKTDYERVATVIRAIHPEVVALQELDSATTRSNGLDYFVKKV